MYSNIYPTICCITQFIWKLLYMFWVLPSPIIRSANNYIYSICYLSRRYCYLPLSWKSWNWFECAVDGTPDDGWWYQPKHVEQFPDKINCVMFASCWIYNRKDCVLFIPSCTWRRQASPKHTTDTASYTWIEESSSAPPRTSNVPGFVYLVVEWVAVHTVGVVCLCSLVKGWHVAFGS